MTERQKQLLLAIITEFIETATAVGSINLNEKYRFNVSSATIRNEMAELMNLGYLEKPHSSAGRVPTSEGLRLFVDELLDDYDEMDVLSKERIKQTLHSLRFQREQLIREGLDVLVRTSGNASVALIGEEIYYAGLSDMLNIPEFREIDTLQQLMRVLENYSQLSAIFNQHRSNQDVRVLIGDEIGIEFMNRFAVVFSELRLHSGKQGFIAVIGPNRMQYAKVIPSVNYIAKAITEVVSGW